MIKYAGNRYRRRWEKLKRTGKTGLLVLTMLLLLSGVLLPLPKAAAYTAPEFRDASFHEAAALAGDRVRLDVSCLDQGYVAVSATSDMRLKFQVVMDDMTYNYDLPSNGTREFSLCSAGMAVTASG